MLLLLRGLVLGCMVCCRVLEVVVLVPIVIVVGGSVACAGCGVVARLMDALWAACCAGVRCGGPHFALLGGCVGW